MKRRIFTGLAAAAAVTASIVITSQASAADATPELSATNTAAQSAGVTPNAKLPAAIQVDAAHHVVATLRGVGKQVYDCSDTGVWTFREPVAGLFTSRGVPAAIHGKGPFWASFDGSHVDGSGAVSPPASPAYTDLTKNVPWLRLAGAQPTQPPGVKTTGVFSNVDFIQRIDTVGGVAPTEKCTAPSTKAVDYTANYVFWAKN